MDRSYTLGEVPLIRILKDFFMKNSSGIESRLLNDINKHCDIQLNYQNLFKETSKIYKFVGIKMYTNFDVLFLRQILYYFLICINIIPSNNLTQNLETLLDFFSPACFISLCLNPYRHSSVAIDNLICKNIITINFY